MLKVTKTRQLVAEFFAQDGDQQKLVKTTVVNTDNEAVSTTSETLHDPDLYAKNRISMRKHEQELREMRYKIEDAILAELETDEHKEQEVDMHIEFFNFFRSLIQTEDGLVLYALALIVSMEIIDFVTGSLC